MLYSDPSIGGSGFVRITQMNRYRVMVLNLLCVWMNRDSTLLEVFFHSADAEQGPAKFLIFSLLIQYIHWYFLE